MLQDSTVQIVPRSTESSSSADSDGRNTSTKSMIVEDHVSERSGGNSARNVGTAVADSGAKNPSSAEERSNAGSNGRNKNTSTFIIVKDQVSEHSSGNTSGGNVGTEVSNGGSKESNSAEERSTLTQLNLFLVSDVGQIEALSTESGQKVCPTEKDAVEVNCEKNIANNVPKAENNTEESMIGLALWDIMPQGRSRSSNMNILNFIPNPK
jgi:hypothetical protein